jgi:hypothetical protein
LTTNCSGDKKVKILSEILIKYSCELEENFYVFSKDRLRIRRKRIIMPFEKTNIEASSIHFAQFNLSKLDLFLEVFNKTARIADLLNCNHIVIHPNMGRYNQIERFLNEKINPNLKRKELYLCWETFESKRRVFGGIENMFKFCKDTRFHRICRKGKIC